MSNKQIDVLILSAGKGTRIKKQFGDTPKVLIKHNGEIALNRVLFPFKNCVSSVPFRICLNIRKDEEQYFKDFGMSLFLEDIPLGNAGAIKVFGEKLSDPFIVTHNDIDLKNINPLDLYMAHLQNDNFVTMTIHNMSKEKEYGIVVKKHNKVIGFTRERWVNCGFYCVSHKVFEVIEDGFQDIDQHMLPRLSSIHQLSCYEYDGFYEDWGK